MSKMYLVSRRRKRYDYEDGYGENWITPLMIFKTKEDIQKWAKDTYGIPYHEIKIDENADDDDSLKKTDWYAEYRDRRFDKNKGIWIEDRRWSSVREGDWEDTKDISEYEEDFKYRFESEDYMEITLLDVFE